MDMSTTLHTQYEAVQVAWDLSPNAEIATYAPNGTWEGTIYARPHRTPEVTIEFKNLQTGAWEINGRVLVRITSHPGGTRVLRHPQERYNPVEEIRATEPQVAAELEALAAKVAEHYSGLFTSLGLEMPA